jgi:hypothetical protein
MSFTIKDALEVQARQLEELKIKLSDAAYAVLEAEVEKRNTNGYKSAYDVFRGQDMDAFASNWAYSEHRKRNNI